jgi:hypothetical protein
MRARHEYERGTVSLAIVKKHCTNEYYRKCQLVHHTATYSIADACLKLDNFFMLFDYSLALRVKTGRCV